METNQLANDQFLLDLSKSVIDPLFPGSMFDTHAFLDYIMNLPGVKERYGVESKNEKQLGGLSGSISSFLSKHKEELGIDIIDRTDSLNILGNESENTLWVKR